MRLLRHARRAAHRQRLHLHAKHRNGKVVIETLLETLGVTFKHSRPYHPQTCGKVERFHQTLKKFLTKQPAGTLTELQTHLERFVTYYNQQRLRVPLLTGHLD